MQETLAPHEITVVVGSHRHGSQSRKVADQAARILGRKYRPAATHMLDLSEVSLPFWGEGAWSSDGHWGKTWASVSEMLHRSSGFVIVSPEWGGMAPAMLKNFFLLCSGNELAHKAGLLIGVSAGTGGSYPIAELRMSSYKNTRICYIPDHVIVRDVGTVFNGGKNPAPDADKHIRQRLTYTLGIFAEYVKALSLVRASKAVDIDRFPFGM